MVNFANAEAALVSELISGITQFTADNCKAKDYQGVYNYALSDDDVYYWCYTEFAGGSDIGRGIWQHIATLNIGIFFHSSTITQIDDDIRTMIDALFGLLLPEHRLSGGVLSARIIGVDEPLMVLNADNNIDHVRLVFRIGLEESNRSRC